MGNVQAEVRSLALPTEGDKEWIKGVVMGLGGLRQGAGSSGAGRRRVMARGGVGGRGEADRQQIMLVR